MHRISLDSANHHLIVSVKVDHSKFSATARVVAGSTAYASTFQEFHVIWNGNLKKCCAEAMCRSSKHGDI